MLFACAKAGLILLPLSWRLPPPELALPARRRGAVALPRRGRATRSSPAAAAGALRAARARPGGRGPGARGRRRRRRRAAARSTPPARRASRRARCSRTRTASGRTSASTWRPASAATTSSSRCCRSSTSAAGTCRRCSRGEGRDRRARARSSTPGACCALIEEKRVTTMMGVPPIYLFLAQEPRFADADLSSLRRAVVGGAPMPEALLETWAARGTAIVQGYGLTEAAPNVLCLPPEDAVRKLGFAGKPYAFVEVRLSDEEELQVRGPNVFPGYWRNPEATARGVHRGRLAAHRRRRRARRRGLLPDQGAPQGHVHLGRRERLSGRGRGGAPRAPAASRTPPSSACRTSAGARSASPSSSPTASRDEELLDVVPRPARALQGAEVRPVRRRDSAERHGQGAEAGAAGDGGRAVSERHRRRRPRALEEGRRDAAGACSRRPSTSSASSATTTRRS